MGESKFQPVISFRVTKNMKYRLNDLAKGYNTTISAMIRLLVEDMVGYDGMEESQKFREYPRRKETPNA